MADIIGFVLQLQKKVIWWYACLTTLGIPLAIIFLPSSFLAALVGPVPGVELNSKLWKDAKMIDVFTRIERCSDRPTIYNSLEL